MRLLPRIRYRWLEDADGMAASLVPFVLWPWRRLDPDEHFTRAEVGEIIARARAAAYAAFHEADPEEFHEGEPAEHPEYPKYPEQPST